MSTGCRQENCTVGETGTCLLNHDPATCPNRILEGSGTIDIGAEVAPLKEPVKNPRFPLSQSLGRTQLREMMGSRYCRLIGILGPPDAGKTAALVSLYLLLARDRLTGMHFADSRSLMAFDEISQGARRWNEGKLPEQLTAHTELAEDRGAGFLHLRLSRDGKAPVDILLPDLPGEWTTAMVEHGRVDRLQFLKGADVIWLMVDGRQLSAANTRQLALHRAKLLMQRVVALVGPAPRVILVITRRDTVEIDKVTLDELQAEAASQGLVMTVMEIASFADAGPIAPGTGIRELVEASIVDITDNPPFWPDHPDENQQPRAMMRFKAGSAA
jgi:hypothetical protein